MMLSRKGLSLDRLLAFLRISDAGGIARAAPGEPVRQSQLSRQLKELEQALGKALFLRRQRRLVPTAAGERLARVVRELQAGLERTAAAETTVRVRLAAGDSVLTWLVLPLLGRLRHDSPGLELEVAAAAADTAARALEDHEIDLALLRAREATGDFATLRLGVVRYALFTPVKLGGSPPLAIPTTERGLAAGLAALGPAAVRCATFPQVAAAVRSGAVAGVLPQFARRELPAHQYRMTTVLERDSTELLLAWRPGLDVLQPELKAVRRQLATLVRAAL